MVSEAAGSTIASWRGICDRSCGDRSIADESCSIVWSLPAAPAPVPFRLPAFGGLLARHVRKARFIAFWKQGRRIMFGNPVPTECR